MTTPYVSILVSADDHSPDPEKFIAPFFSQTAAPDLFEVVFIDYADHANFRKILAQYQSRHPQGPHFHYHIQPGIHRAKAHNHAINIARGTLLVFFSEDFIAPPTLVSSHLALHQRENAEEIIGIGSSFLSRKQGNPLYQQLEESGKLFGAEFSTTMHTVSPDFFYVGNTSIKKSFIERCGLFDEHFPFDCWDDYEMGQRLIQQGMRSLYVPEAAAEHDHALTLAERCRAMRRLGYSAALHEHRYPMTEHFWRKQLKRSPLNWEFRAWRYRLRHKISGNPRYLAKYFNMLFSSHFVRGHYLAQSGVKPDCAPLHTF